MSPSPQPWCCMRLTGKGCRLEASYAVISLAFFIAGSVYADVEPQAIALQCQSCHISAIDSTIPSLAALSKHDLRQALFDFKYQRRPATLMPRLLKGYDDHELEALADWLGR